MKISGFKRVILCSAITSLLSFPASAELISYWPITEAPGAVTATNAVPGGTNAELFGTAAFVDDFERDAVLQFDGVSGSYANAGVLPALTQESDFTWSFWARNDEAPPVAPATASNNVILGNRYAPEGGDSNPREFIKFTPHQYEWHHDGIGENIDYADLPSGQWVHLAVVKDGERVYSFRDGYLNGAGTIAGSPINPQPLFFGGDRNVENWTGAIDDVALWNDALSFNSVIGIARGQYTPATAPRAPRATPVYTPVFTEDFSAGLAGDWTVTTRGLENNAEAGYAEPTTEGGVLTLGGTTNAQYWYGRSIETVESFDATKETRVSVDRVSLAGSGTAHRSSIWIWGDESHYLHFSQNVGETGWSYNANDGAGIGTRQPTGSGVNIPTLDALDSSFGEHKLTLQIIPMDVPGSVNILMYLDDTLVGGHGFSEFPEDFQVILTGQARAGGDTVEAVFDNLVVEQVPEPSTALLLGGALAGFAMRRRRK